MSSWSWKIRQAFSNLIPVVVIGAIAFGGWHFYKKGTFRHGIAPAISSILHKVPYFGTRFKHYTISSGSGSYATTSTVRSVRRHGHSRRSAKRHHGHARRHRRHHR